jgi:hypothetical protein
MLALVRRLLPDNVKLEPTSPARVVQQPFSRRRT